MSFAYENALVAMRMANNRDSQNIWIVSKLE